MSALCTPFVPSLKEVLFSPSPAEPRPWARTGRPSQKSRWVKLGLGLALNALGLVLIWQGLVPTGVGA
ncbi:hypothetical protein PSQ20_07520 [Curvibacter sp. RS43]|uniref:hypothetical protein n=1 Tax=Curvibacter microcysteis TaxID=3026419 RepID=UPI00235F602C|nr:hypothetical protein [Curvibacter sp. RS43]MDD0810181.1 hypothetical protein [Curvibacter sp. RS43]